MIGDEFEFGISLKELQAALDFAKRHGESWMNIKVVRASIGDVIMVTCPDGNSETDITEYDRW